MPISKANVPTERASNYLKNLCRHWAHRFPVEFDDHHGVINLDQAVCTMNAAGESLEVTIDAMEEQNLPRLESVVAEHLQRFGFRETLVFNWIRA